MRRTAIAEYQRRWPYQLWPPSNEVLPLSELAVAVVSMWLAFAG